MADQYAFSDNLGYLLNRCADQIAARFAAKLEPYDITLAQWGALLAIHRTGEASPSEIARRVGIDRGAATRLIARMEEKGLIERRQHPKDGRAVVMTMQPRTAALMPELITLSRSTNADVLNLLPAHHRTALMDALADLNAALSEDD